jgi:hypothetical protein
MAALRVSQNAVAKLDIILTISFESEILWASLDKDSVSYVKTFLKMTCL